MRVTIKYTVALLLTLAAVSARPATAQDAQPAAAPQKQLRADLAIGYSYLRSNAPPGGCTCFNMNGGNINFAWPIKSGGVAVAADLTVADVGNVGNSGDSLTLTAFTTGLRYIPPVHHSRVVPFGQALIGFAHASGSLAQAPNPLADNATIAFAANLGGGVDLRASRRVSIRLAEADYLLTTFDNGANNHQNNLRLAAGLVFHF